MASAKKNQGEKRSAEKDAWISAKIEKIMKEGVRGKKVSREQAAAIAYSMWRGRKK